jgi:hypothetical protein
MSDDKADETDKTDKTGTDKEAMSLSLEKVSLMTTENSPQPANTCDQGCCDKE